MTRTQQRPELPKTLRALMRHVRETVSDDREDGHPLRRLVDAFETARPVDRLQLERLVLRAIQLIRQGRIDGSDVGHLLFVAEHVLTTPKDIFEARDALRDVVSTRSMPISVRQPAAWTLISLGYRGEREFWIESFEGTEGGELALFSGLARVGLATLFRWLLGKYQDELPLEVQGTLLGHLPLLVEDYGGESVGAWVDAIAPRMNAQAVSDAYALCGVQPGLAALPGVSATAEEWIDFVQCCLHRDEEPDDALPAVGYIRAAEISVRRRNDSPTHIVAALDVAIERWNPWDLHSSHYTRQLLGVLTVYHTACGFSALVEGLQEAARRIETGSESAERAIAVAVGILQALGTFPVTAYATPPEAALSAVHSGLRWRATATLAFRLLLRFNLAPRDLVMASNIAILEGELSPASWGEALRSQHGDSRAADVVAPLLLWIFATPAWTQRQFSAVVDAAWTAFPDALSQLRAKHQPGAVASLIAFQDSTTPRSEEYGAYLKHKAGGSQES